ncbi:cytochrome P450 [Xylariomycetidae sp. FL2044]|nr:cytochrome P450 [Xylariomycetidae sp. FL2044]
MTYNLSLIFSDAPMALLMASFLLVSLFTFFAYRVFFHPLRRFPGPLAGKLSDIRNGYYAMQRNHHLITAHDHVRYGAVMRHGPNKLLFNTALALQDIYDNERIVKSHVYSVTVQSPGVFSSFNIVDQSAHRHKRKIIGQVLSDRSMRIFEPIIASQADVLIKLLYISSRNTAPVNMSDRFEYLSCDIVTLLGFGHPLKLQTDQTYRFMCQGMVTGNYYTNTRMQFFRIHQLKLSNIVHFFNRAMREKYKSLIDRMISIRMSEDTDARHDLFSVTSKANSEATNPREGIRMSEVWSGAATFLPAGAFSISTTMSGLLFYLSRYPEYYERLAHEIRTVFATEADIKFGVQLSNCRYLRACIDETLRMELQSNDGEPLVVDGHVVPPGTQVGVNTYSLHHNEKYFPNSYEFNPERWLDSSSQTGGGSSRDACREAFVPFSIGYRDCVGKNMAYLVMSLVVTKIIWYFDFESPAGAKGKVGGGDSRGTLGRERETEYQLYDIFSATHDGPYLVFKPRGDACSNLAVDGLDLE